jgi:prevent-host-death family protein
MRVVGIRQLKAKLSEYLREVQRGEVFLVTDRDRVVAELRPARSDLPASGDELDQAIEALAATGEVQRARAPKADWTWSPRGAGLPVGTAAAVLEELRSDRSAE